MRVQPPRTRADARVCRIGIPVGLERSLPFVAVYDDGSAMDVAGLRDLWHIGESPKIKIPGQKTRSGRKLIGKFGIGKLATYAVANKITYICRQDKVVYSVACDFRSFESSPEGITSPVALDVFKVVDLDQLRSSEMLASVIGALGLSLDPLLGAGCPHWTICLLEDLKPKVLEITLGRLRWVLRTALPLRSDFKVYLNGEEIRQRERENPGCCFLWCS